ncbi:Epidermal growth factor receptor kinase substrate 8 [Araneus ventricosus]|uniref:Epidermal growth factor receptor kinase substrate 8 n=1 Tax=Araneus ventricosus TaxID=182803 RepID=A0A4Y2QID3_ARAVE|nr:Epidermal growth factor receptor kinase substrate 8 [Araneus ventricosus]
MQVQPFVNSNIIFIQHQHIITVSIASIRCHSRLDKLFDTGVAIHTYITICYAKLKSHIHDPNAPELVHFLFTPLALIVDAARDSNYSSTLASRVVAPLLTRDAIELLMNCCTSKESDLWHSLGDSWVTPREHWEGFEGSYHPVFSDGWAPENPFSEEIPKPKKDDGHRSHEEAEARHQDFRVSSRQDRYGNDFYYNEQKERPVSPMLSSELPHSTFENRYYDNGPAELPRRQMFDR